MKISINLKKIEGSYGGVIAFGRSLEEYLRAHGHQVVNDLKDSGIDVIVIAAQSKRSSASYSYIEARIYQLKHPQVVIINRVNNSDEGRGTNGLNKLFLKISWFSDHNIFISQWVRNLFPQIKEENSSIIRNGGDRTIFNFQDKKFWSGQYPIKIVTHHWSTNLNKGFDIYLQLDEIVGRSSEKIEFYYIGNIPSSIKFNHTKMVSPKEGLDLSDELKKYDLYITAARNEAGGMHHIEGAMCGLPILYVNSGALPEYCADYGVMISKNNLEEAISKITANYAIFQKKLKNYRFTADNSNKQYLDLFLRLIEKKRNQPIEHSHWLVLKTKIFLLKTSELIDIFSKLCQYLKKAV